MMLQINSRSMLTAGGIILAGSCIACLTRCPAATAAAPVTVAAHRTITTFLRDGKPDLRRMQNLLSSSDQIIQRMNSPITSGQVPVVDLRVNPFRGGETISPNGAADKQSADDRAALVRAAATLQLQSILRSDTGQACMINESLYREGEPLGRFTVDKIGEATVVIRCGEYRFELKVQR